MSAASLSILVISQIEKASRSDCFEIVKCGRKMTIIKSSENVNITN